MIIELQNHVKNGDGAGELRTVPVTLMGLRSRSPVDLAAAVQFFEEKFGNLTGFDYDGGYLFEFQYLHRFHK